MTSSPSVESRPFAARGLPPLLMGVATGIGLVVWGFAAWRHGLLQSNAYDLGLFDQWAWLIGTGAPAVSSMEQVHVLADHGAWLLYLAGAAYWLLPSVQWLANASSYRVPGRQTPNVPFEKPWRGRQA